MGEENRKGAPEEPRAFQKVLGALNQGQKIRALEIARKHGIPDDDPVWHVVLTIAEAEEGFKEVASSLREASVKVTEASAAVVKESREKAALEITKLRGESVIEINEMKERAKGDIAKALGITLTTEIGKAVDMLQSKANRPLHKKWLIGMLVVTVVSLGLGGWGFWNFSEYKEKVGEAKISAVLDASEDFSHFMKCDKPGWKKQWINNSEGKKILACYPYPDSKGNLNGWMITP